MVHLSNRKSNLIQLSPSPTASSKVSTNKRNTLTLRRSERQLKARQIKLPAAIKESWMILSNWLSTHTNAPIWPLSTCPVSPVSQLASRWTLRKSQLIWLKDTAQKTEPSFWLSFPPTQICRLPRDSTWPESGTLKGQGHSELSQKLILWTGAQMLQRWFWTRKFPSSLVL